MTWAQAPGTPWWFVLVVGLAGFAVGEVFRRPLATSGYRLDDEGGPGPRVGSWVVTVSTGLLWALLAWRFGPLSQWALAPAYLVLATIAVALSWVDADVHRLPRGLTRPAYAALVVQLALASWASGDWAALRRALVAGAVLWVVFLLLALLAALLGSGFGFGDVTLAGIVGLASGYVSATATLASAFLAFLLAGAYGVVRLALRRGSRKDDIAFGPWMLVGLLVALVTEVHVVF